MNIFFTFLNFIFCALLMSSDVDFNQQKFDRLDKIEYTIFNGNRDTETYIDATSFGAWNYFSFETNSVVATVLDGATDDINNIEASLDWDLAFRRNHIKTNSGLSGPGQGGGYVDVSKTWTEHWQTLDSVPEDATWLEDEEWCCAYAGGGVFNLTLNSNLALAEWGAFGTSAGFGINNYVMFVKDADGELVKFWPYNYYNSTSNGGHIEIRYDYVDLEPDCTGVVGGDSIYDDCGECWTPYCYFGQGNFQFLSEDECASGNGSWIGPNNPGDPFWNDTCTIDCAGVIDGLSVIDDCGECWTPYCYYGMGSFE
ncbi:MAG: hypothetical protein CBC84_000955, partial [Pelagibacteraceae bacterium TMED124]